MTAAVMQFSRRLQVPFVIDLKVEITPAGVIEHIDGDFEEGLSAADELRLNRAVYLVTPLIEGLKNRGDLIEDALLRLPADADFDIERALLGALADLQKGVLDLYINNRGAA